MIDARTSQGLPAVQVSLNRFGESSGKTQVTDLEGRFRIAWESDRMMLQLEDGLTGRYLGSQAVAPESIAGSGADDFVLPVEVGPTVIVRLLDAPQDVAGWRVALSASSSETGLDSPQWSDASSWGSEGDWIARYRKPRVELDPKRALALSVKDRDGNWEGDGQIEGCLGVHRTEIRVHALARLRGRVVNEQGESVSASVSVFHRGSRHVAAETTTNRFEPEWVLEGLEPGPARLVIRSEGRPSKRLDVEVVAGKSQPLEIVLPTLELAGDIKGELVGPSAGRPPLGVVLLESTGDQVPWRSLEWLDQDHSVDNRAAFSFGSVPAGTYQVTCLPLDGRVYAPRSVSVAPPAEVQFVALDASEAGESAGYLFLRLRDAATGEELSTAGVRIRLQYGGFWDDDFNDASEVTQLGGAWVQTPIRLVICVFGYRPTCVQLPDALHNARSVAHGTELEVQLHQGFGAAVIVLDGDRSREDAYSSILAEPGVAGARVRSGGRTIGVSDETGLALCSSDRPIESIEVELEGWVELGSGSSYEPELEGDGHGLVYMVRE